MRLWDLQNLPQKTQQDQPLSTSFYATVNTPGQELSFWIQDEGQDSLKRLLGCLLISYMPSEGIDEALMNLKEIWAYYIERAQYRLPEPEVSHRGTGKIVGISERPDLVISE